MFFRVYKSLRNKGEDERENLSCEDEGYSLVFCYEWGVIEWFYDGYVLVYGKCV